MGATLTFTPISGEDKANMIIGQYENVIPSISRHFRQTEAYRTSKDYQNTFNYLIYHNPKSLTEDQLKTILDDPDSVTRFEKFWEFKGYTKETITEEIKKRQEPTGFQFPDIFGGVGNLFSGVADFFGGAGDFFGNITSGLTAGFAGIGIFMMVVVILLMMFVVMGKGTPV